MLSNEEYYGLVEAGKTLCHHGVRWQAWGVQNGPPYPLGSAGKARAKAARHILGGRKAREERLAEKADSKATMASINRKLVASKIQMKGDKASYKLKKAADKAAVKRARHVAKQESRDAKAKEQLDKLKAQQELAKQKTALKDARHKGSIEFRLKADQLMREQYKNEKAKLKAERDRVSNKAAKDATKARLKAEKQAARDRLANQKADRKNQLKMEKERLKMQEREKIRQEKIQQKVERKAEAKANSPLQQMKDRIINSGDPKMLKKYGKVLNSDEYKAAVDRIKMVNDLKSAKAQQWVDRGKRVADTIGNVATATTRGIEATNNAIKVLNFFRGRSGKEDIKLIGAEKKATDYQKQLQNLKDKMSAEELKANPSKYLDAIMKQSTGYEAPKAAQPKSASDKLNALKDTTAYKEIMKNPDKYLSSIMKQKTGYTEPEAKKTSLKETIRNMSGANGHKTYKVKSTSSKRKTFKFRRT